MVLIASAQTLCGLALLLKFEFCNLFGVLGCDNVQILALCFLNKGPYSQYILYVIAAIPKKYCTKILRNRVVFRSLALRSYAKFSKKLTFLIDWYVHVRVCIRVKSVNFSGNFASVLNE